MQNSTISSENKNQNKINSDEFIFKKSINFKNVYFNYPERVEILKNINLSISKNSLIGIKGETGSGKSTFIKLLMNLLQPTKGVIQIDGVNINTIGRNWQNKIGYIPQNFYILDDTILENIIFSEDESKFEIDKINSILKFCKLYDVVNNLPKKLDTIVGPSGKQLSGGQAQRLAMARALYQDKDILIFDEATNALDESTESEILKKINNLKNTKTIIIISHNNKVLEKCDQSYNIENGYLKQI